MTEKFTSCVEYNKGIVDNLSRNPQLCATPDNTSRLKKVHWMRLFCFHVRRDMKNDQILLHFGVNQNQWYAAKLLWLE